MGWSVVKRLPLAILPRDPKALVTMATSRVPAALWSQATTAGHDAPEALADDAVAEGLLRHAPDSGVRTDRSAAYLRWRTAFAPLRYRLLLVDEADPAQGGVIFRLRRRGEAVEAAIIEDLVPDWRTGARLVRRLLRETGADYAIGVRSASWSGLVPVPIPGPVLTSRPLASTPPPAGAWTLSLGDIELF